MDTVETAALMGVGFLAASYVGSQVLVRFPGTRAWIRTKAIEGYNYLDKIKEDVPPELLPSWQAAYDGLDAVVDAFADDELSAGELRRIGYEGVRLVNEVRKIFV